MHRHGQLLRRLCREIARRFGAEVLCADLSTKSNEVNRQRTMECGLEHLVKCPKDLSFTNTEAEAETYDCVVSQDSFLHAVPRGETS